MKKLYDSRAFWMIVSLLASITLWIYVSSVDKEEITRTFRGVKVELEGEDILRDSQNLVINGYGHQHRNCRAERAQEDNRLLGFRLYHCGYRRELHKPLGLYLQAVHVEIPGRVPIPAASPRAGRSPETINFMVSSQVQKTIQVRGSFDGELAEGYTAEMPVFEPSTIVIYRGRDLYQGRILCLGSPSVRLRWTAPIRWRPALPLWTKGECPWSNTGITFSTDVVTATLPVLDLKEVKLDVNIIEGAGATTANTKITHRALHPYAGGRLRAAGRA